MRPRPQRVVAAVTVGWGSIGVLVRWIDLPPVVVVAGRCLLGCAGLGAWLAIRHRPGRFALRRQVWARLVASGLLLAAHWVALFAAFDRAPIGTVLLLLYVAPVLMAAGAALILRERPSRVTVVALGIALVGSVLVVGPGADDISTSGLVLSVVAAVLYAAVVLMDKPLAVELDGAHLAFTKLGIAGIAVLPFAVHAGTGPASASWGWLLVLGLVETGLAYAVFLWGLARLPVATIGVLAYLEPASAVVFGWVFLGEVPTVAVVLGGLMILTGGILVARSEVPAPAPTEVIGVAG